MAFLNGQYTAFDPHIISAPPEPEYVDDVIPLGFDTYNDLVIRDDVITGESIQDVPVYIFNGETFICGLYADFNDPSADYVSLQEIRRVDTGTAADTGMPIRILAVQMGGDYAEYYPEAFGDIAAGWNSGGVPCSAPTISDFTPTAFLVGADSYDDLDDLTDEAKSALRSLSQCINVTASAMGTIYIPYDAVVRFNGTIEENRKYYFSTDADCTFTLPELPWSVQDAQFVIYLYCSSSVDLTFPTGTLIAGGSLGSDSGSHKLFGSYIRDTGAWCIGGVDYNEVTT